MAYSEHLALRELRARPFLAPGGERVTVAGGASTEAAQQARAAALCQAHARVRAIEWSLAETLDALHDPAAGTVPAGVPLLLCDTVHQLIAIGVEFQLGA